VRILSRIQAAQGEMKTFKHSGKLGDIVYSLPAVRALGGGSIYIAPEPRLGFTEDHARSILPLLEAQPYVDKASLWDGQSVDDDLDRFRRCAAPEITNLADQHLFAFDLPAAERDRAWLQVEEKGPRRQAVFNLSPHHHGITAFWPECRKLFPDAIFVGLAQDHQAFQYMYGEIAHVPTEDLLALAQVIASADVFVGNQSAPYAIAEGLKVPCIQQTDPKAPNAIFDRPDARQIRGEAELEELGDFVCSGFGRYERPPVVLPTAGQLGQAQSPGISIVIVTYNSAKTIGDCIESVLAELGQDDELLVVDNASRDETCSIVGSYATVQLIRNSENLGFSAGCNVGLRVSKGEYLLLLNPDTILRPEALSRLKARFADEQLGAVGPVSNNVSGQQFVGFHLPEPTSSSGLTHEQLHDYFLNEMYGRSALTKLLIGFCLMTRRSILDKVGLFEEDLFLGSDDLELCWRLRSHGYRLAIATDIYVQHSAGTSFATEPSETTARFLRESAQRLQAKLERYYAQGPLPSGYAIWGSDIFPKRSSQLAV
jgi:GT2 family glycosyltransferase